jgi:hypothetical protein
MTREVFEIIEGLERWAEYHGNKSDQDVADLAGRLRKLFTKEESVIQTPEEFAAHIVLSGKPIADITTRDAAIRAEAREGKRKEVVAEIKDFLIDTYNPDESGPESEVVRRWVKGLLTFSSFLPPKPAIDPRAVQLMAEILNHPQPHEFNAGCCACKLCRDGAALISERVAQWKEAPDGN